MIHIGSSGIRVAHAGHDGTRVAYVPSAHLFLVKFQLTCEKLKKTDKFHLYNEFDTVTKFRLFCHSKQLASFIFDKKGIFFGPNVCIIKITFLNETSS